MPVAPTEIGYNGLAIRPDIAATEDHIENLLRDPVYVENNNKATTAGHLRYVFVFEGQLNEVERSSIENGWTTAGWTTAVCRNDPIVPQRGGRDLRGKDQRTWSLTLVFTP